MRGLRENGATEHPHNKLAMISSLIKRGTRRSKKLLCFVTICLLSARYLCEEGNNVLHLLALYQPNWIDDVVAVIG